MLSRTILRSPTRLHASYLVVPFIAEKDNNLAYHMHSLPMLLSFSIPYIFFDFVQLVKHHRKQALLAQKTQQQEQMLSPLLTPEICANSTDTDVEDMNLPALALPPAHSISSSSRYYQEFQELGWLGRGGFGEVVKASVLILHSQNKTLARRWHAYIYMRIS